MFLFSGWAVRKLLPRFCLYHTPHLTVAKAWQDGANNTIYTPLAHDLRKLVLTSVFVCVCTFFKAI